MSFISEDSIVDITLYWETNIQTIKKIKYPILEQLQEWVGGYIEIIPFNGYDVIVNEEGISKGLFLNTLFNKVYNKKYVGNVVVITVSK